MNYIAKICLATHMPENEGLIFSDFASAKQHIINILLLFADDAGTIADEDSASEYANAAEDINHETKPFERMAGDLCFYIRETEEEPNN